MSSFLFIIKTMVSVLYKSRFFYFLFLSGFPLLSYSVNEKHFKKIVLKQLYPQIKKWSQSGSFKGVSNIKINYQIYGKNQTHTKPLVIIPGWSESSLKYMELAYDLIQHSFSPVYVLDHRGQGLSGRVLKDREKSYVKDFLFYSKDMEIFLNIISSRHPKKKPYLIAHSMGSTVSLFYILENSHTFRSIAIIAPMLRINASEFLQNLSLILSPIAQFFFPKQHFIFNRRTRNIFFEPYNKVSHSIVRYEFNKYLENRHPVYIRGATLKWVEETVKKTRQIRKKAHKISPPLLILSAGKDIVVDNKPIEAFCLQAKQCSHIKLKEAKHEILMEKDEIRNKAIKHILKFFKKF